MWTVYNFFYYMLNRLKLHIRFIAISIFFFCFCIPDSFAGMIEGIVLTPAGPLADAQIVAYPDFASLASESNGIVSQPGEKPGQFQVELQPGKYYFIAHGFQGGNEMYSYHGLNPVTVAEDYLWLPFFAVESSVPVCSNGTTGVGGAVLYKEQPLTSGMVSVYPLTSSNFRGMGLLTNTLDQNGRFWFDLEPGSYVVIARKRQGDTNMGPLQKGDLFCYADANPLQVKVSTACELTIFCYPRDDLNAFLENRQQDPRGRREERRRTASLHDTEIDDASARDRAGLLQRPLPVSGTVRDLSGKPAAGLYVTAYPADQFPLFQMYVIRMITDYMAKTDKNGAFQLDLEAGRTYYLVARQKIGEAPDHLELYGLYEGNANHSITVGPGRDTSQVDIVVEEIMP
jgi:hypothetical protein